MASAWSVNDGVMQTWLDLIVSNWFTDKVFRVMLFKNNYFPVPGSELDDLVPADFAGYLIQSLDGNSFSAAVLTDHIATTTSSQTVIFTASEVASPQTVYGYAVLNEDMDIANWMESFDLPRVINPGDTMTIIPRMRLQIFPAG